MALSRNRALKGHSLLGCHLREAGGWGAPGKHSPQVRTWGSRQGAPLRCTRQGAARVLPTTFLCRHPFLQKGVTKKDHLHAAALARAVVSLGGTPPGFAWTHATETWHCTWDAATLWSCGFAVITGHSARIPNIALKTSQGLWFTNSVKCLLSNFPVVLLGLLRVPSAPAYAPGSPGCMRQELRREAGEAEPLLPTAGSLTFPHSRVYIRLPLFACRSQPLPGPQAAPHCPPGSPPTKKAAGRLWGDRLLRGSPYAGPYTGARERGL